MKMERWEAFRSLLADLLEVPNERLALEPDDESYKVEGLQFKVMRETPASPYQLYFEATSRLGGPTFRSTPFTTLVQLAEQWERWVIQEREQQERQQRGT